MLRRRRQNSKQKKLFSLGMLTSALLVIFVTGVVSFFIPSVVRAISFDYGLGATLGLGTADLLETVINIVQWALGLLGLVAVIIIMYGGFIWMTAKGNQDKIEKAKKILFNGLIGLAIILLSWAIVFFVMRTIEDATSGTPPGSCGAGPPCTSPDICCPPGFCAPSCGSSLPTDLEITEVEVAREPIPPFDVYQCSKVKTRFNANIDPVTVESAEAVDNLRTHDTTTGLPFDSPSGDDFQTVANTITYSHEDLFPINTDFEEWYPTVGTPIQDYDPRIISSCGTAGCSGGPDPWVWPFHVGTENDDVPPEITSSYPVNTADASYPDRNVPMAPVFTLNFNEPIDDNTIMAGVPARPNANFELWECTDDTCTTFVGQYLNGNLLAQSVPNGVNIFIEDPFLNPLNAFTWYQVRVHDVEDLCGNPMVAPEIWNFQTNDATPGVQSWYPTGANECPGTDIYITFNTTMYYNQVGIVIDNGAGDTRNAVLEPHTMGWPGVPIEVVVPGEGTFKVMDDPGVPPVDNGFRIFKYEPDASWVAGTNYTVDIVTDMVINIDGDLLLHNWSFDVGDPATCTCSPFVSNYSPSQGPRESCLTVQGACFAGTPSNPGVPTNLIFNDGVDIANGVIGGYGDNYITSTIPAVYDDGDRPEAQVELTYDDPSYGVLYSADYPGAPEFFVNSPAISNGPCLWSINPTAGYEGNGMSANGIRFGDPQGAGDLEYGGGVSSTETSWNDTDIATSVPAGALDGDVTVTDDGGQISNGIYFDVLHVPPGTPYITYDTNCAPFPSSPTPWIGREDVCRNTQLSVRFNEPMDQLTFDMSAGGSILLQRCTDPGPNPCDTLDPVLPGTFFYWASYYVLLADPTVPLLDQDAWYQATITADVQSAGGINMASDYVWQFKTSNDPGACPITDYSIFGTQLFTTPFETGGANAVPMGGVCQPIDPTDYTWNWLSQDPAVVAVTGWIDDISDIQAQNTEGSTIIEAWVDEVPSIPHGELPVEADFTYCEDDADCSSCPGSVCIDAPSPHCSPVVNSVVPGTAPVGDWVTVEGCMFGGYAGSANIEFTGAAGWVDGIWPAACGPAGSTWSNNSVVVEVPNEETADVADDAITGPIRLTNEYGDTDNSPVFNVGGASTPNLCYLTPNFGTQGQIDVGNAVGEGFGDGSAGYISWLDDGGTRTRIFTPGPFTSWNDNLIEDFNVPFDAVSSLGADGVMVNAGSGNSNPVDFYVTCADDSECSTGCCYANQCADIAMCSGGGPGAICQIPTHPDCSSGPIYPPAGYECISDTGEPPIVPDGDDCRFCCRPGDIFNGLTCIADQGDCLGTAPNDRGLYCGCVRDDECGDPPNVGCGDMGGGTMCCTGRPSVVSVNPWDGEGNVCMNRAVVVEFDQIMDTSTFINLVEFEVVHDPTGTPYSGTINSYFNAGHTFLEFTPNWLWAANDSYTITVSGDPDINDDIHEGVLNQYQVGMNGDFVSHFTAGDLLCNVDHVEIDIGTMPGPTYVYNASQDLYVCTRDDCPDDMSGNPGNQHRYIATAMDGLGNPLTVGASYDWSNSTTNGVLNVEDPGDRFTMVSTLGPDGTEMIRTNVDLGAGGSGSAVVSARVESCDNPWPNATPYYYPDGLGIVEPMNFTTYYCRDGGLPGMVDPLIEIDLVPTIPGVDELLREVFFSTCDADVASCTSANSSGDAIGIRVMENESFLSPTAWFNQMFPSDTGACNPFGTVDGYQACRAGRTTYVAATNLSGGTLYPNIYLISYNDGANGQTTNIYNQITDNWFFNSNVSGTCNAALETDKVCITRDTKRVTELGEIGYLLLNYQYNNGAFPGLAAGTFLPGFTMSKWPSWMAEFGNEIGISPPVDPINEFEPLCLPIPPWDPAGTCWNDEDHRFWCPSDSHTYAYLSEGAGLNAYLFARLEYFGVGTWLAAPRLLTVDPCSPLGSDCGCYNYWAPSTDNFWITNWSPPS